MNKPQKFRATLLAFAILAGLTSAAHASNEWLISTLSGSVSRYTQGSGTTVPLATVPAQQLVGITISGGTGYALAGFPNLSVYTIDLITGQTAILASNVLVNGGEGDLAANPNDPTALWLLGNPLFGGPKTVRRFDLTTHQTTIVATFAGDDPSGLVFDNDDNLYVFDTQANTQSVSKLIRLRPSGGMFTVDREWILPSAQGTIMGMGYNPRTDQLYYVNGVSQVYRIDYLPEDLSSLIPTLIENIGASFPTGMTFVSGDPVPVSVNGFSHTPVGSARLTPSNARLEVAVGPSGGGVAVGFGVSRGFAIEGELSDLPVGGQIDALWTTTTGMTTIGLARSNPNDYNVVTNLEGATTYRADLYAGQVLVASHTGVTSGQLSMEPSGGSTGIHWTYDPRCDFCDWCLALGITFTTNLTPGVFADTLVIIPEMPPGTPPSLTGASIISHGPASFSILGSETVSAGQGSFPLFPNFEAIGRPHQAVGDVQIQSSIDEVMIHNALPGGLTDWNRGARISFGHAGSAGFDLAPLPAPASLPNDSGVQVSYVGSLGGVPQQVTGSVSMVDIGSIIGIDPQVPAASYTVRILMNEQLVATVPGLVGRITGPAQFPTGYGNVLAVLPSGSESGVDLKWSSSGSQSFTLPNGQSYVGNEIQLVGASMTHVDWVSHVTVLMRGIAEVVIRNEVVTQVGGACPADFNTDGVVNSQDYFDFLAAFFASAPAADFNHSGAIDSQDFFDFLTAFFAGC